MTPEFLVGATVAALIVWLLISKAARSLVIAIFVGAFGQALGTIMTAEQARQFAAQAVQAIHLGTPGPEPALVGVAVGVVAASTVAIVAHHKR